MQTRRTPLLSRYPPTVLFFGMRCAFSLPPLAALITAAIPVRAIVLPAAGAPEPDHPIDRLARDAGIPIVDVPDLRQPETITALAGFAPDALVVACCPWRLPEILLELAPLGGLNVHPSLLPALRGPEPVFWALRRGERRTGVTLHRLDAGLDTGPVVAQTAIDLPPGVRAPALEATLAELGAGLLVTALGDLAAGSAAAIPQDHTRATAAPAPAPADWLVPTDLPAGWAYGFARGVAPLGGPLTLLVMRTGERLPIADALAVDPFGTLNDPIVREGERVTVRFRPGTATFLIKP